MYCEPAKAQDTSRLLRLLPAGASGQSGQSAQALPTAADDLHPAFACIYTYIYI